MLDSLQLRWIAGWTGWGSLMRRTLATGLGMLLPALAAAAPPEGLDAALEQWARRPVDRYQFALADLNADGERDVIVHVSDPSFCGNGGCPLVVFRGGGAYTVVASSGNVRKPIYLLNDRRGGWQTLAAMVGFANAAGITPIPYREAQQSYRSLPAVNAQIELTPALTDQRLEFEEVEKASAAR